MSLPHISTVPDEDFLDGLMALNDCPLSDGSGDCDYEALYESNMKVMRVCAPATSEHLEGLWNTYSEQTKARLLTIQAAFYHLQLLRKQGLDEAKPTPRSVDRDARAQERAESKAQYDTYIVRCRQRRAAIDQADDAVAQARKDKRVAVEQLVESWDLYIAHLKAEKKRLEGIRPENWTGN